MCIETEHVIDDRTKRIKRRKFSNAKQRFADSEIALKPVKPREQPMFESDDPLAGIDLRRIKKLRDLE
jgi:hypothetical protein